MLLGHDREEAVMSVPNVEVVAFHGGDRSLSGFIVSGRWPASTREWAQFLALAVRLAAVPGLLPTTTVFRAVEEMPDEPQPGTVGLVTRAGPVLGEGAPRPGQFPYASALLLLHPPAESRPSTPEAIGAASGCVLLPGLPHLGLEHRAAWVEAEMDGTVTRLVSQVGVDPALDPDTAVLAMLLAA
ncbi:MAG TPA: peptidase [Kineosporiaceae bacterium]|nr:peptidase [Kineosporiaceae bacterium]